MILHERDLNPDADGDFQVDFDDLKKRLRPSSLNGHYSHPDQILVMRDDGPTQYFDKAGYNSRNGIMIYEGRHNVIRNGHTEHPRIFVTD